MAKEGIPFIVAFFAPVCLFAALAVWVPAWWVWIPAGICLALTAFMAYFFRDPERTPPPDPGIVVSPADGKVMVVERVDPSDAESPVQVSIFLSPLDVHVNRSPVEGLIEEVVYKPGRFEVASKKIASEVNEQNVIRIKAPEFEIIARQIAGILARRIVCWKKAGDSVKRGERIGLMKFSSRMDVVLPADVAVLCSEGDRVVAGETIIGRKQP